MIKIIGENIVDMLSLGSGSYSANPGGSPFNVAVAVGRLGVGCAYLSPISSDSFGKIFARRLTDAGVRFTSSKLSPLNSSIAMVNFDAFNNPEYSIYRSQVADRDISLDSLKASIGSNTQILHTGSLALEPEDFSRVFEACTYAHRLGVKISVDFNVRKRFISNWDKYLECLETLIPICSFIKASDEDLQYLSPQTDLDSAIQQLSNKMLDGLIAYTAGPDGAALVTKSARLDLPIYAPTPFVDTIGAGDTFYATLLASLVRLGKTNTTGSSLSNTELEQLLHHALIAASINISRAGCTPPNLEELTAAVKALSPKTRIIF